MLRKIFDLKRGEVIKAREKYIIELLTAEREQVRKIHNTSFRRLLLQKNTKMAKTRVVNLSDLFPFRS
jgi:cell division protein FtsL